MTGESIAAAYRRRSAYALATILLSSQTCAFTRIGTSSTATRNILQSNTRIFDKKPFFADVQEIEITSDATTDTMETQPEFMAEASDALKSVGWSAPMASEELTENDPFVQRINAQIQSESGVELGELLNPAKVVNLERDLYNLRSQLASLTGKGDIDVLELTTKEVDGGGGGDEAEKIRAKILKKEKDLLIERRSVFRGWLKNIFLGQAILSLGLSWFMATDPSVLFGGFDWYHNIRSIDISIQVLGFWWYWLFIIPSLRSRRPSGFEKKALDIAFLASPAISLVAPAITKDTGAIWIANFAVVVGSYAFAYLTFDEDGGNDGTKDPAWLKFIFKSLDFGTGKERGARN